MAFLHFLLPPDEVKNGNFEGGLLAEYSTGGQHSKKAGTRERECREVKRKRGGSEGKGKGGE